MIITRIHPKDEMEWELRVEHKFLHSRWTLRYEGRVVTTGWELTFQDALICGNRLLQYALSI
jgi:hypothetical protein